MPQSNGNSAVHPIWALAFSLVASPGRDATRNFPWEFVYETAMFLTGKADQGQSSSIACQGSYRRTFSSWSPLVYLRHAVVQVLSMIVACGSRADGSAVGVPAQITADGVSWENGGAA